MSAEEFGEDDARRALEETGLELGRAELVRLGSVAGFSLLERGWLARVSPTDQGVRLGHHEVAVGKALERAGVPAARLAPVTPQPIMTPSGVITLWEFVDHSPVAQPSPREMGKLCFELHERTAGGAEGIGPLDPLGIIANLLRDSGQRDLIGTADLDMLHAKHAELIEAWPVLTLTDPLGMALCHGDLHEGNALMTRKGPVLIDLETAGNGMRSYDHTAVLVHVQLYGQPRSTYDAFADAYGFDLREWSSHPALCDVYAMWTTAWSVVYRERSSDVDREAEVRLDYWRGKRPFTNWTLQ